MQVQVLHILYNISNSKYSDHAAFVVHTSSHKSTTGNPTWTLASLELYLACECLAKLPSFGHHVREFKSLSISVGDSKREILPRKVCQGVPLGTPVARHGHPVIRTGALDIHGPDGAGCRDIGYEHKIEVVVPVDREPHPTSPHARNSASKKIY